MSPTTPPDGETWRATAFVDKGGTGKTSAIAHLGVVLATDCELDVLLIDLAGKQGDLAKHFGLWESVLEDVDAGEDWPNIATTFKDEWSRISELQADADRDFVEEMIRSTDEGPDLIPTSEELDGVEEWLGAIEDRRERWSKLDRFLTDHIDDRYDVVLIDAAGSTSDVVMNALYATRNVIAMSKPSPFDEQQAQKLRDDLETILDGQGIDVKLLMVMLNELDAQTIAGTAFRERFEEEFGPTLAPAQIPSTQDMVNAQMRGGTLFELDEPLRTAERAIDAYRVNGRELVRRFGNDFWDRHDPIRKVSARE